MISPDAAGERAAGVPAVLVARVRDRWSAVGATWLVLAGYSFLRVPVPGVNEPHYLTKAKAYWDPAWCAGDLFLESSSPHRAFYLCLGWLTRFLSLQETAIVGRFAVLAVVAWGWTHLTRALALSTRRSLAAITLLLLIQTLGSWSGEWLVGGVESKVFAYGFAFAGFGAFLASRVAAAGLWLGLATTAHPLVGAWAMLVAGITSLLPFTRNGDPTETGRGRRALVMSLWWCVAAAPGIVWALPALKAQSAQQAQNADYIQVTYRLAHHLDPWKFPRESHRFFGGLLAAWIVLRWGTPLTPALRKWDALVAFAVAFGLLATVLSLGDRPWPHPPLALWPALQIKMLKFYPFRLPDMLVAVTVAVRGTEFWASRPGLRKARWGIAVSMACYAVAILVPGSDQNPARMSRDRQRDWRSLLRWVRENTPPESLLLAANEDYAAKWFAGRPEYVSYKDCPQDVASLEEWNRRLGTVARWAEESLANDAQITADELQGLYRGTGVDYVIASKLGPFAILPEHSSGPFHVYRTH